MKVNKELHKALIRRLASNGGDKELTKHINEKMYDFDKGEYKEGYRELLAESLTPEQRRTMLAKAPHTIHGKGSRVYAEANAPMLAGLNDEDGGVAINELLKNVQYGADGKLLRDGDGNIQVAPGISADGAQRLVEEGLKVAHSSAMSGEIKKGTTSAIVSAMKANEAHFRSIMVRREDGSEVSAYELFVEGNAATGEQGLISSTGSMAYTDEKMAVLS